MTTTIPIDELKADLRKTAFARRDALPPAERQAAAEAIAARPFPLPIAPGIIVSGFSPLKTEINPLPLMRKLAAAGARLALPVVAGRGKPLIMRAYAFGQPLNEGVWGIREPKPDAPEVDPDILIVPLAAFDRRGHRIGYGAGYYDMTINRLRSHQARRRRRHRLCGAGSSRSAGHGPRRAARSCANRAGRDRLPQGVICEFSSSATSSAAAGATSCSTGCPS